MYWDANLETLKPAAVQELQLSRLRQTVERAGLSPFYGRRFKEAGVASAGKRHEGDGTRGTRGGVTDECHVPRRLHNETPGFRCTPSATVARSPMVGSSKNPVAAVPTTAPHVIAAVIGLLLLFGSWTAVAGVMLAVIESVIAFSHNGDPRVSVLLASLGVALALLGAGAWWPVELVARKREEVASQATDVDPHLAHGLDAKNGGD